MAKSKHSKALLAALEGAQANGHSLFSPSGAEKWMACSASLYMEREYEDSHNDAADLGSDKHELSAICLTKGTDPDNYLGRLMHYGNEVDDEFAAEVRYYVEAVKRYALDADAMFVERIVETSLTQLVPKVVTKDGKKIGQGGTADVAIVKGKTLTIIDAKFGYQKVSAEENKQMLSYGEGLMFELAALDIKIDKVVLVIIQPQHDLIDEWPTTPKRLLKHATASLEAGRQVIEAFNTGKPTFNPGPKQCQWCRAKADCPAAMKLVTDTVAGKFVDLDAEDAIDSVEAGVEAVKDMDTKRLSLAYSMIEFIDMWKSAVYKKTYETLQAGIEVPDWKLINGRKGDRKFSDEEKAAKIMQGARLKADEMYSRKLITPPQAEKLLKDDKPKVWTKLNDLVVQAPGRPAIAHVSDKRAALQAIKDKFENLDNQGMC